MDIFIARILLDLPRPYDQLAADGEAELAPHDADRLAAERRGE